MHALPDVPKCSAGYRGGPGLDLVDLFVGSEGTLGVLLEVELATAPRSFAELGLLVGFPDEASGLAAVGALRKIEAVAALECIDARCTELMREAGHAAPGDWLLLVQLELPAGTDAEAVAAQLSGDGAGAAAEVRALLLREGAAWEEGLAALPGDEAGSRRLGDLREAAPQAVFGRIAAARRESGEDLHKVGGDAIVPLERLAGFVRSFRSEASARDLDLAVWGHVSDGNLHPNVIVRSRKDMERGEDFLLAVGRKAIELGGSPLAEHGVGRHPLKQRLLRELVGDEALPAMRRLKRAFDPAGILAPGVLFSP
jgi:D-lactate dehydrogenase (cytochrome)